VSRHLKRHRGKRSQVVAPLIFSLLAVAAIVIALEAGFAVRGIGEAKAAWYWDASTLVHGYRIFVRACHSGSDTMVTTPQMSKMDIMPQAFKIKKEPGSIRIFCVGGSTTAGWPYHRRGSYPTRLAAILSDLLPATKVEVINAGFHGFDSSRAVAVVQEVARFSPDMILFYSGYNDYQVFRARHLNSFWKSCLRGLHYRLVLYSRIYNFILGNVLGSAVETSVTRSKHILKKAELQEVLRTYRSNLFEMINTARSVNAVPVLFTLPFSREFLGRHPVTETAWPRQNTIIRDMAKREKIPLVDAADVLHYPRYLVDSIHSNNEGYHILALRAARSLCKRAGMFPERCQWKKIKSEQQYRDRLGISDAAHMTHVNVAIGLFYMDRLRFERALEHLLEAERVAPNPRIVYEEIENTANYRLFQLLVEANKQLGHEDRAKRFQKLIEVTQ